MLSVASMLRRMFRAMKYAAKEEHFAVVAGAAATLIAIARRLDRRQRRLARSTPSLVVRVAELASI